jgi:hypothetical protein
MRATLESTTKIVELAVTGPYTSDGIVMGARIWEGCTEKGIRFHAYIVRVAVANDLDQTEFATELRETRAPSADVVAIPLRLIL